MARAIENRERGLEQPGSAGPSTIRRSMAFAGLLVACTVFVVGYGHVVLAPYPQFATFQSAFVLIVDVVTGWMLLGQFAYRRRPVFAILGAAYLFSGLVMVPFVLSFPGALRATGPVIGGAQSSAWVWHLWHIVFPALVAIAIAVDARGPESRVPAHRARAAVAASVAAAIAMVLAVGWAVTAAHGSLPALLAGTPGSPTPAFFAVGVAASCVTAVAMAMAWRRGWRSRTLLHLWLAVALLAMFADLAGSLASSERYTVGWYFGRVESMAASSVLLFVILARINLLHRQLAATVRELSAAHDRVVAVLAEKDALVESLRRSEEQVRRMAYFDTLTELPNRRLLLDRLGQARAQAARQHTLLAVLFTDLDRFKEINDTLGHDAGDELLRQVAQRLSRCVRSVDTVARSGGDEFVIVLPQVKSREDAGRVAAKLIGAFVDPFVIRGKRLAVTTSVGIAIYPDDDGDDLQGLMKKADMAMYAAKDAGRNAYRYFRETAAAQA